MPDMDTYEARSKMCDVAAMALATVRRIQEGPAPSYADASELRELLQQARTLLSDAGYPGEAVWRALQRASMGIDTHFDHADAGFWDDISAELRSAVATLESLIMSPGSRNADINLVG
jgi:hypothetical protein